MPPKDKINAAQAAAAETLDPVPLVFKFRERQFTVERDVLVSARFLMAIASGQDHRIMFETLDPKDVDRFMTTLQRGESLPVVAAEFLGAVSAAAGWGNSRSS